MKESLMPFVRSSEIYPVWPRDILALNDTKTAGFPDIKDEVVVLIGNNKNQNDFNAKDTLVKGRRAVLKAVEENRPFIPVRFVFIPANKRFDVFSPLIRKLRYKIRFYGSNVYHIAPESIRELKIERTFKTRENAYSFTAAGRRMTRRERDAEYDNILNSIKENGFSDDDPIDIMLCRLAGAKDCVNNGHHRMGIALELGLDKIPVRFSAAGAAPKILRPALKVFSTLNLAFKRRFGH